MKRLIRNYNYALSISNLPLWSSLKGPKMKWKQGCAKFIITLATDGSKMPPLFCLPRAVECFFPTRWTGSLLSQSYGKSSCIRVLGITHIISGVCLSRSWLIKQEHFRPWLKLDPHLPPPPQNSTISSASMFAASMSKIELDHHRVHSLLWQYKTAASDN